MSWLIDAIVRLLRRWFGNDDPDPVALPHPEEPRDDTQTLENVNVENVFDGWYLHWDVPPAFRDYWRNAIVVNVTLEIQYPAQTWTDGNGRRHLDVRPEWCNPGVIAHEQAHNSYALLGLDEMARFSSAYQSIKGTNPLLVLLFKTNAYGLTDDIEAHAEIYRYLGQSMPEELKIYYRKLF